MLNQCNKKDFSASNIIVLDILEKGFNGFEIASTGELVDERRVRWVVVFEAHLVVFMEERQSFIWVLDFFEVIEKMDGFAKKVSSGFVRSFMARI